MPDAVAAATKPGASSVTMITGTVVAGTLSTTQMTTNLTEATNETHIFQHHYEGMLIIWTSGVLIGQVSSVTIYVGSGSVGLITHPASTDAPSNGDTFTLFDS